MRVIIVALLLALSFASCASTSRVTAQEDQEILQHRDQYRK
jgi:hypothetical protein